MLKEKAKEGNGSFPRACRSEAISVKPIHELQNLRRHVCMV